MNEEINISDNKAHPTGIVTNEEDYEELVLDKSSFSIPHNIKFVRIVWCDNANIIRAKAVYKDSYDDLNFNVGIPKGQQGVTAISGDVIPKTGLTPADEIHLEGDISTFTSIPYSKSHGRIMGNMMKNGSPWDFCPRGFMINMIKNALKMGIEIKGSFENEFYLLKEGINGFEPTDNSPFASTYSMDINVDVILDIVEALTNQGMEVQQYYPESGPGQQEITINYTDALKVCDNQIAFRETVRAIAGKHGLIASFLPKIFEDKAGSGCHLHLSLWNGEENILGDLEKENGISTIGSYFLAGILHHLPALMAITTPIPNSYHRIKPNYWSGAFKCWGMGNREAAIRGISETDGIMRHFELKTIDASSNPYLAFGAVIAAGIHGIKENIILEEPIQENPGTMSDMELKSRGIVHLPSKLGYAISELEKDKIILDAMGKNLSNAYIAVKKAEIGVLKHLTLEEEVNLLIDKY